MLPYPHTHIMTGNRTMKHFCLSLLITYTVPPGFPNLSLSKAIKMLPMASGYVNTQSQVTKCKG